MFHHLLKAWRTDSLYLSPHMAALFGSSLPPLKPSTVMDSVPVHGRALLHRLRLTRCLFLVRRHVVPARLPLTRCQSLVRRLSCGDMSCQLDWVAMFDAGNIFLPFRGEGNFTVPFDIALASLLA